MKKSLRSTLGACLLCLGELMVGILLLIKPIGFTTAIIIGAGCLLAVLGAVSCIRYFRTDPATAAKEHLLARGLCLVLAGLFCTLNAGWFIATFPVLTMLYGAAMLLLGLARIQWTADALRMKHPLWYLPALAAAATIILAVVILLNPFASATVLWQLTAIALIAEAFIDGACLLLRHKRKA